jgi:GNAT superfamily N-acetyltransferase
MGGIAFDSSVVPEHLPRVRHATPEDAALLAQYVQAGRREGTFRAGPQVEARSVLEYQRVAATDGREYHAYVIEEEDRPIGYFDVQGRGTCGEILGLYLQPSSRGKRMGRHLFRWAIANLRARGCRTVSVEIYAGNDASLRAAAAAGFNPNPAADRTEDGRRVVALRRATTLWPRLGPDEPRYRLLSGENLFLHHAAMAEALVEQLAAVRGVQAILGLGSIGRGFGDVWSDVDLAVLGTGPAVRRLPVGESWVAGVSVDLFVVDLAASPLDRWDDARRQAVGEGVILHCSDPALAARLRRIVRLRAAEQSARVSGTLLKLGWLGFCPRTWVGHVRHGYLWPLPHDLWLRRGHLPSAHATADQALALALQLLFLVNGRLPPDPKWLRFLAPGLSWLPDGIEGLLYTAENSTRDDPGFATRADAILRMVEATTHRLEAHGELATDLYRSYLKLSPEYAV